MGAPATGSGSAARKDSAKGIPRTFRCPDKIIEATPKTPFLPAPSVTSLADGHNFPRVLLGILSDTHSRGEAASAAVSLLRTAGAAYLIHCGDVGSESVLEIGRAHV